jgi:hypothetical protein
MPPACRAVARACIRRTVGLASRSCRSLLQARWRRSEHPGREPAPALPASR